VTGYFHILRAAHARELEQVRTRNGARTLVVVVLPAAGELLPQRARAELAAALRVVDYVVTADDGDVDGIIGRLEPVELVRLETDDALRTRQLMEHVHRRQTC